MFDLKAFVVVSIALFCMGVYAAISRKNSIQVLIGIELIINAATLNFVAFGKYDTDNDGQIMGLFIIMMAAIGVAVALAIIINVFRHYRSINPHSVHQLNEND